MIKNRNQNIPVMKRLIISLPVLLFTVALNAQYDAVDALFNKYSDRDGFTTVTISGKLLGLFADKSKSHEENDVISRLTSIKILSVENPELNKDLNFYNELKGRMDFKAYEELMDVKEGSDITKFLIRQKGERITELLVISGGPEGNTLISIRGDLDLKSLSELSEGTGMDELKDLEDIDKK